MKKTIHQLNEAKVNNNCPECYSTEGLKFTFFQEEMENKLYSKANGEVTGTLQCENCNQIIYPVKWTEDIEQVFNYHKKVAKPKSTGVKLKPLAYILLVVDALLIGWVIYYLKGVL
ncbi:MAG: hypothetical protein JKY22_01585 [Flavobacteriaceae bacterium]|nr:hypothetical protein [Flavobacteriaceae bacterium]